MPKVTVYQAKCSLCGAKVIGSTLEEARQALSDHIDNECKGAKALKEWEKAGILKEMIAFARSNRLGQELQKLLKRYSLDEIKDELERLEIDKAMKD